MSTPSQQWWLEPEAFAALGPTQRVSVSDCMYLGSWAGRPKSSGDELMVSALGVSYGYRAFDPKFTIPWEKVTSLTIEGPRRETKPPLNARRLLKEWSGTGHSDVTWLEGAAGRRKWCKVIVGTSDGGEAAFETWEHLAHELTAALAPILERLAPARAVSSGAERGTVSVAGEIRKLAALHDDGILTDEEFQAKKAELLSRM